MTTATSEFQPKAPQGTFGPKNHVTGTFIVSHEGIPQMKPETHRPWDVKTGEVFTPSQIVPHQFLPMSADGKLLASLSRK